jgi:hypothetical protein
VQHRKHSRPSPRTGGTGGRGSRRPLSPWIPRIRALPLLETVPILRETAGWYGWAFSGLSVLVIAAGLGSSAIAAGPGKTNNTAIAILGLVVALGTAVNRLWRPGLRAVVRSQTANSLRREGWAFVCTRDKYAEAEPSERIPLFVDEVERINVAAESIDEQPVDDQPGQGG